VIQAFTYASIVAVANIAGGALIIGRRHHSHGMLHVLTAFGAGFMLAVAILEMLPSAVEASGGLTAVLLGYLAVHLTQHVLTPHFHFGVETHSEAMASRRVGIWALIGLVPHAFFDGVAIASGFLVSSELGLFIFTAVLLHKIPTGVSLASIMLVSGSTRRQALVGVTLVGFATIVGAVLTPATDLLAVYGLPLAAGVTIYVAASNLIPESQREPGWMVPGGVFLGVAAFYLARMFVPGAH